ncbi:hypothetical protein BRAS3843_940019 [Bradyrhizobium sp. STM 3843]|nr:hypothetical protein BRAS3843_940019 [Bradyrhizobium sp. STM 3843]
MSYPASISMPNFQYNLSAAGSSWMADLTNYS